MNDAGGELDERAAPISSLLDLGVEPQVRVATLERPLAEGVDLLVQALADARHLALKILSPSDSTTWSTLRVETPATYASPRAAPHQLGHLRLHQLMHDPGKRLAQEVEPSALEQ